ncbi:glycosyltransferase [Clostridium perfringens]|uniref:glycosyltransferase n=1 Tax=Clostridium perfringens TaxID=1502 RepID=UPI001A30F9B3|nr:glycosyltransferase [Clostridium perfringens]ELC8410689.1 glycosyltransferase [Clostridium perfringens]HAT4131468.1 glycosyltransferase [Clostridium perfringens]HAT4132492.1 glycosyltransferase [Clostridium perfringens]
MVDISIIMGVYNCEDTLEESIDSIIKQTFKNWELIICDDGSSDKTYDIANKYSKMYSEKIILLKNSSNKGLNYTLNRCLKIANGKYIARMDGDDISLPNRLQKEIDILNNRIDIDIVSSSMIHFDENGDWKITKVNKEPKEEDFIFGTQFCHAPCMVRKEAYLSVNGYSEDKKLLRVEDYHLWVKMYSKGFKGINIEEPLYKMRDDKNAFKRRKFRYRLNESYVKYIAFKSLNIKKRYAIYILKPIFIGILPYRIYNFLRKK